MITLVLWPIASLSESGCRQLKEAYNHQRATNEGQSENRGQREKKRGLAQKVSPRFITKIFAADIQKRWLRPIRQPALKTVEREFLVGAVGDRKFGRSLPRKTG